MITITWRPDPRRIGVMLAVGNDGAVIGHVAGDGNGRYRGVSSRDSQTFHARSASAAAKKLIAYLEKRERRQAARVF